MTEKQILKAVEALQNKLEGKDYILILDGGFSDEDLIFTSLTDQNYLKIIIENCLNALEDEDPEPDFLENNTTFSPN